MSDTVITCHANADFDALAAMIAAGKLYPDAAMIFPNTQDGSLKDYFIQSVMYLFDFKNLKDLDTKEIRRLVIVDTRNRSRLEHVDALFSLPGLSIHLFDHHPPTEDSISADVEYCKIWGSTTEIGRAHV